LRPNLPARGPDTKRWKNAGCRARELRRSPSLAGNARVPIRDRRMAFWDRPAPALTDRSVLGRRCDPMPLAGGPGTPAARGHLSDAAPRTPPAPPTTSGPPAPGLHAPGLFLARSPRSCHRRHDAVSMGGRFLYRRAALARRWVHDADLRYGVARGSGADDLALKISESESQFWESRIAGHPLSGPCIGAAG
jgi:hypothetical protein